MCICFQGWTITDAAVVCQQLGYVLHPDDWRVYANLPGAAHQPIWRSFVQCTQFDNDILHCEADSHLDHSCNHEQDVYVRCKPPTWAGESRRLLFKVIVTLNITGILIQLKLFFSNSSKFTFETLLTSIDIEQVKYHTI